MRLSENDKEAKNQKTWDRLETLQQQHLDLIHKFIDADGDYFAQCACEAVLGILYEENRNPLLVMGKDSLLASDHYLVRRYSDLARAILAKHDHKYLPDLNVEYIPLKDWISTQMPQQYPYAGHYTRPENDRILSTFFLKCEEDFGYAILRACTLVYQGMPLYEIADGAQTFTQVSFEHHDYIYLAQKGKRSDTHETGEFPDWAEKYFIKREHLAAHKIFFSGERPEQKETDILRIAYRQYIGISSAPQERLPANNREHKTKLLDIVDQVISRYYGDNFNLADRDSWPKQVDVIGWLRSKYGLSERLALAVDLVTRPDNSRRT